MSDRQPDTSRPHLDAVVERQRTRIEECLTPILSPHSRVALVNFPNHHNVGDAAIWLGTLNLLRKLGVRVSYSCEWRTYDRNQVAASLRRGVTAILICGGGNLGDQYPAQQSRAALLRDFPSVTVVQLPQSIWFEDPGKGRALAALADRHRDFTLFVRDRASLETANSLGIDARLCPDTALALGPLVRPALPTEDVAWLRRVDRESCDGDGARLAVSRGDAFDWMAFQGDEAVSRHLGRTLVALNRRYVASRASEVSRAGRLIRRWLPLTYRTLAVQRLAFGVRLLSRGRMVVSDRLHGHLLATMLGIPNVAVANRNGKVRAYFETWITEPVEGLWFAESHESAANLLAQRRFRPCRSMMSSYTW